MHDLVHDLACSITRDECFPVLTVGDKELVVARCNTTRHLAITHNLLFSPNFSLSMFQSYLRTLFQLGEITFITNVPLNFSNLICLRVLDLRGSRGLETLPEPIARLKLLRYLDLSRTCTNLLSDEVFGNLINLQTLKLCECGNLEMLPGNMRKLTNLRHLDISGSTGKLLGMPVEMGQLKSLRQLSHFIVSEDIGCGVGELQELDHLGGSLAIKCLWKVKDVRDAENAKLSRKENIRALQLDWLKSTSAPVPVESQTNRMNDKLIADALQPHPNIKSLEFYNYGGYDSPRWMNSTCLFSLVSLLLNDCPNCKYLPTLGLLPHLKELFLRGVPVVECIGNEFYCDEEEEEGNNMMKAGGMVLFPVLEVLEFSKMLSLEEWKGWSSSSSSSSRMKEGEQFPVLKTLTIQYCAKLSTIPPLPMSIQYLHLWKFNEKILERSLENLTVLQSLDIVGCTSLVSLPEGMQNLTSLKYLAIENCHGLKSLNNCLQLLTNLHQLTIGNCPELELLPDNFQNLFSLQSLHLYALPSLPEGILQNLTSLKNLTIKRCDGLKSLNKCLQLLTNLRTLRIMDCRELELFPGDFQNLVSLQSLHLCALPKLAVVPVLLGSTLETISFLTCAGLTNLPEWITNQKSLKSLGLFDCKNLKSLPEEGLQHLTALQHLQIRDCHPELHRRCQKNTGEDWHKIAHIPRLCIDLSDCKSD